MLQPEYNLPPGVHVETDRDAGTVHVVNASDAPVVVQLADVMRSFGVTVGAEEGIIRLWPTERFTFHKGATAGSFIEVRCTARR